MCGMPHDWMLALVSTDALGHKTSRTSRSASSWRLQSLAIKGSALLVSTSLAIKSPVIVSSRSQRPPNNGRIPKFWRHLRCSQQPLLGSEPSCLAVSPRPARGQSATELHRIQVRNAMTMRPKGGCLHSSATLARAAAYGLGSTSSRTASCWV